MSVHGPMETVGVAGTGIMGAAIARNLARSGYGVKVWNRTRERAVALAGDGIEALERVRDLETCDAIITMLADAEATEDVMVGSGLIDSLTKRTVWIQMGTIGPEATRRMVERCEEREGPAFLDAPVLGTKEPAERAQLTVLIAGREETVKRALPILWSISAKQVALGERNEGSRMKLVVNAWLLSLVAALAESLSLTGAFGLEGAKFLEAIAGSGVDLPYAQIKGPAMLAGEFPPSFPLRHARKDVELLLSDVATRDARTDLAQVAAQLVHEAMSQQEGDEDVAAVGRIYDTDWE